MRRRDAERTNRCHFRKCPQFGCPIADIPGENVYETHPTGLIALQINGIKGPREFAMAWRSLKIRPHE